MANLLSKFGDQSKTTYSEGTGLRYTDNYWGGETGPSARRTGFIPNTPISPIQMNTLFSQTTMCSYILGQVLASNIIRNKDNNGGTVNTSDTNGDVVSTKTTDDVREDYATPLINFLDRINNIRNQTNTVPGGESVWRSRQIGYGDSGDFWRVVNPSDTYIALSPSSTSCQLWVNSISRFNGSTGGTPTLTFNASSIESSDQINAPSASITGLTSTGSLSVSKATTLTGALTANGTVTLGSNPLDIVTINGNTDVKSTTITIKGGRVLNIGETSGGTSSSNRATAYLWARYNSSNTESTYTRQSLENILYNIGTRLDNLGFSSGDIEFLGQPISSSLRRQGNYVICSFMYNKNITTTQVQNYIMRGKNIFTFPNGFIPAEDTKVTFGFFNNGDHFGSALIDFDIVSKSNHAVSNGYLTTISFTWSNIVGYINFGYVAVPR